MLKKSRKTRDNGSPSGNRKRGSDDETTPKKKTKKSKRATETDEDILTSQGIQINEQKVKTEPITDTHSFNIFTALSPPPSDSNSTDDFDELLGADFEAMTNDVDSSNGEEVMDLAISGMKIEPPSWWTDSLTGNDISGILNSSVSTVAPTNQPATLDASLPHDAHPWMTKKSDIDEAIAALGDMEKLFGVTSPMP